MRISLSTGVACMVAGAFCFSLGALFVKLVGEEMPSLEIVFARSLFGFVYCWSLLRRDGRNFFGKRRGLLALRGVLGFMAFFCSIYAFVHLPLADASVMIFLYPVFVALLAALLLGEHLGILGVACVLLSLSGVVFVAKPSFFFSLNTALDPMGVTAALAAALISGTAIILVRILSQTEHPLVVVIYPILAALVLAPILDGSNWVLPDARQALLLLAVGLTLNVGQHFMTKGFSLEPAGKLSAVMYLEVVFAGVWGVLAFSDVPDLWSLLGAGLIIGGTFGLTRLRTAPAAGEESN